MSLVFTDLIPYIPNLLKGLSLSIIITVSSMVLGSLLGIIIATLRTSNNFMLTSFAKTFIEVFRNTPILVQLYLLYFGLAQFGIHISPLWTAIIGMTINTGAYSAEIFRSGYSSVSVGIQEAGLALGFKGIQLIRLIYLPIVFKNSFPALANHFILLFLFSSIASIVTLEELTYQIMVIQTETARTFEIFIVGIILYYSVSSVFAYLSRKIERNAFKW